MTDAARRHVRAGAATAVAQVLVMAGSSLLGLLIARRLGSSGATDGFFAANAVYGVALFTAQSLRTTAPATLLAGDDAVFARHLRAVGLLAVAVLALFGLVAAGADAIASDSAVATLRLALAVLAPAAVAQLLAGLLAARCAVLGEFARPAGVYACGTLAMAATFVVLVEPLGVDAIAVAVSLGALLSSVLMAVVWRRVERTAATGAADVGEASDPLASATAPLPLDYATAPRLVGHLLRGALPVLASQAVITVSIFAAGRVAEGDGTLYSYGTLAISVLVAIVASPVSIVLAPEIARAWDRRPATLLPPTVASYRLGALLLPVLALPLLLLGPAFADWLLTALSDADVETVFAVSAIMVPSVLAVLLGMVPLVGAVAAGRLGRVGAGVALVAAIHVPAAALAASSGSILLLAVEGALAATALSLVPVAVSLGGVLGSLARTALGLTSRYVLPSVAAAAATWLALGAGTDPLPGLAALAVGVAVQAAVAVTLGRDDLRLVLPVGLAAAGRRRAATDAPDRPVG